MKRHTGVKVILLAVLTVLMAVLLPEGGAAANAAKKIHLDPGKITWVCGRTNNVPLTLTNGQVAYSKGVRFKSENPKLIAVTLTSGRLGIKESSQTQKTGTTRIVAVYKGEKYYTSIKKVNPKINKKSLSLLLNTGYTLKMSDITGVNGKTLKCTWNSSNPKVAIVKDGLVTAKASGKTTITCNVAGQKEYSCNVTVTKYDVEGITLDISEKTLSRNTTCQLIASIRPQNATYQEINWSSSDQAVATVDENGLVTAHNPGKAVITAQSQDNPSCQAVCNITVTFSQNDITMSKELTITGDAKTLSINDATGQVKAENVSWYTDNSEIIHLKNTTGLSNEISGVKNGKAYAVAKVSLPDGTSYELQCEVTVDLTSNEITCTFSRKNASGSESLSSDGMIYLTIKNTTNQPIGLFRFDYDMTYRIGDTDYSIGYQEGSTNDTNFSYNTESGIACISKGNSMTFPLLSVETEYVEKIRKAASNFKFSSLTFYYFDSEGKKHRVIVSGVCDDGVTVGKTVNGEIVNVDENRMWYQS